MKPLPADPFALQARIMAALIDDILDPCATTFARLDALREVSKVERAASADRSPEGQDNADWPDRNDESAVGAAETPMPKPPKHFRSGGGNASSGNPPPSNQ